MMTQDSLCQSAFQFHQTGSCTFECAQTQEVDIKMPGIPAFCSLYDPKTITSQILQLKTSIIINNFFLMLNIQCISKETQMTRNNYNNGSFIDIRNLTMCDTTLRENIIVENCDVMFGEMI